MSEESTQEVVTKEVSTAYQEKMASIGDGSSALVVEQKNEAPAAEAAPAVEKKEEVVKETAKKVEEAPKTVEVDHVLLGGKVTFGEQKESELKLETPEEIANFVKEKLGIDNISKAPELINAWRADSQKANKAESDLKQFQDAIIGLPPQLKNAMELFTKGEDWAPAVKGHYGIDYSKEVKSLNERDLIDMFNPGKFTDENWITYNSSDPENREENKQLIMRMKDSYVNASNTFTSNKTAIERERAINDENRKHEELLFDNSFAGSENTFNQEFPNVGQAVVNSYTKEIRDKGFNHLFLNDDGSLKLDAIVNYALAKEGKGLVDQLRNKMNASVRTEAIQDEIKEKKANVRTSGGSGSGGDASPDAEKTQALQEKLLDVSGGNLTPTGMIY